jgi:hypothetical protein
MGKYNVTIVPIILCLYRLHLTSKACFNKYMIIFVLKNKLDFKEVFYFDTNLTS